MDKYKTLVRLMAVIVMFLLAGVSQAANLIDNSGFEAGLRHWSVNNTHYYADRHTFKKMTAVDSEKAVGAKSLLVTKQGEDWLNLVSKPYVLKSGQKHTLSFYYKSDIPGHRIYAFIHACGKSTGSTGRVATIYRKCQSGWQRAVLEFTIPVDPDKKGYRNRYTIHLGVFFPGDRNGHVWLDGFQLETGGVTDYTAKETVSIGVKALGRDVPLYYTDAKVAGRCVFYAWKQEPGVTVEYRLTDYYRGTVISTKTEKLDLPAGRLVERRFEYPAFERGSYKLWIKVVDAQGRSIAKTDFLFAAITEEKNAQFNDESFFGMHLPATYRVDWRKYWGTKPRYELTFRHDIDPEVYFRIARDIGVKWLRVFHVFHMGFLQPEPGKFRFDAADRYVAMAEKYKMRLMPIFADYLDTGHAKTWGADFSGIPLWTRSKTLISKGGSCRGRGMPLPDPDIFREYVRRVVQHFKGRIKAWEVWNEPNVKMRMDSYFPMQKAAWAGAKAADPDCVVVGLCGTGDLSGDPLGWIRSAVKRSTDIKSILDVISVHSYRNPVSDTMAFNVELGKIVSREHADKTPPPVWNTEVGTASVPAYDGYLPERKPNFAFHRHDPVQQANFLVGKEIMMMSSGVSRHFYFEMEYTSHLGPGGVTVHLMESDGAPRPALAAYDAMTEIMEGARFLETIRMGEQDFCSAFRKGGDCIVFCWNYGKTPHKYALDMPVQGIAAFDLMGRSRPLAGSDGKTELVFSNSPLYLTVKQSGYQALKDALRKVDVAGGRPCRIEFARIVNDAKGKAAIGVMVRNISNREQRVSVLVSRLADGWKLGSREQEVTIAAGSGKLVNFPVTRIGTIGKVAAQVVVNSGGTTMEFRDVAFNVMAAGKAPGGMVVDGRLDEWSRCKPVLLNMQEQVKLSKTADAWQGPDDLSARAYAMWDADRLYLAVSVTDNALVPDRNREIYCNDSLELFFDMAISSSMDNFSLEDYQVLFAPAVGKTPVKCWRPEHGGSSGLEYSELKFRSLKTAKGYDFEISIPWQQLRTNGKDGFVPGVNRVFGFDIAIDDNDGKYLKRKSQIVWSGGKDNCRNTGNYGVVILREQP